MRRRPPACKPANWCGPRTALLPAPGTRRRRILTTWQRNLGCRMARSPRALIQAAQAWLKKAPLMRAFLWGLAAALALPPVHFLPALLFSLPAFLRLIDEAGSLRRTIYTAWCYGFGLALAGLYWITEPVLTEAQTFWWLVPFAAPALSAAVACYTVIPALAVRWVKPGFG